MKLFVNSKGAAMHHINRLLRTTVLYAMAIVLVGTMPLVALAADDPETYTYDATTRRWNSNKWVYDPATGVYTPALPAQSPSTNDSTKSDDSTSDTSAATTANPAGGNAVVDETVNADADVDIDNDTKLKNDVNSNSKTGDAGVKSNTKAGDAKSGNANADAMIINSVHSTVDGETSGIAHFTTNIYGDVVGDITIGPAIDNATVNRDITINSDTNINNDDAITNDVNLRSTSGDAEVSKNTEAGSAKSGNAHAVANVLNLVNTIVAANKSFVGTINIYGNLNGDILVSPDFIPQLLADNSIERTEIDMPLSMNVNDDQSIVNNVKLNATTGDATVRNNTGAGSAKTGNAQTKLTVLNLTGRKVDAKKSLLVFVNVLGKWVGMIVDAPNATAAALGSGVTNNDITVSDNTTVNNKTRITNNIDLSAESGDAMVADNTRAGDATSGDATASANIANVSTSEFQLSDWFGVLFINVFGTWIGSFGIDTEAGTVTPLNSTNKSSQNSHPDAPNVRMGFVPKEPSQFKTAAASGDAMNNAIAAAATELRPDIDPQDIPKAPEPALGTKPKSRSFIDPFSVAMTVGGFMIAGAGGASSLLRRRRGQHHETEFPTGLKISKE